MNNHVADRRALLAIAAQFFVNGALFASFVPRLPEVRDQVGISTTGVGVLLSMAGLGGLLGSVVVGRTIERMGTRRTMIGAGIILSFSLPLIGFARSSFVLLMGLLAMMSFDVLVDVAMNMQGSWLSARRRKPVMNRLHGLWSLGALVGALSASRLANAGVALWAHLSGAAAILLAVVLLVGRWLLRVDEHPTEEATASSSPRRFSPTLVLFGFAGLLAIAVESTSIDWAAFRLADDFDSTSGVAALGSVAVTAGMTVGRFAGDRVERSLGRIAMFRLATMLAGVGLFVASQAPDRALVFIGFVVAGLGVATMLPTIYDDAAKHRGRPGAGLGALTAGLRIGSLTIPALVGTLANSYSVGTALALVTLPSIVGFFFVVKAV